MPEGLVDDEEDKAIKKNFYVLNSGKLEEKPLFVEIAEGFYRFSSLGQNSKVWGNIIEDTNDVRSNYKNICLFYNYENDFEKIQKFMSEGDVIEFFPIGRMCQGGYNISAERQTQQITNSCGSFVLPLAQVNKTANITAIFPSPFDTKNESFSYDLFNAQFQIVNQKKGGPASFYASHQEKMRFFFFFLVEVNQRVNIKQW